MQTEPNPEEDFNWETYHNSPEYKFYYQHARRMVWMARIAMVLFAIVMAGLAAFAFWVCSLPGGPGGPP